MLQMFQVEVVWPPPPPPDLGPSGADHDHAAAGRPVRSRGVRGHGRAQSGWWPGRKRRASGADGGWSSSSQLAPANPGASCGQVFLGAGLVGDFLLRLAWCRSDCLGSDCLEGEMCSVTDQAVFSRSTAISFRVPLRWLCCWHELCSYCLQHIPISSP